MGPSIFHEKIISKNDLILHFFKTKGFVRWFHEKLTIIMKCLVGMSKVNAPCNSIVEILWCGSAAAKAHVCVRTYVMTASASADLKELPLLRSSFDMIQKFVCFVFNWGGIKPWWTPDMEVRPNLLLLAWVPKVFTSPDLYIEFSTEY